MSLNEQALQAQGINMQANQASQAQTMQGLGMLGSMLGGK